MELALKIIAAVFVVAAAYFYSIDEKDWVFACVVLGACSFFLSFRYGIKRRMAARAEELAADQEDPIEG
jgi:hypothetical protein